MKSQPLIDRYILAMWIIVVTMILTSLTYLSLCPPYPQIPVQRNPIIEQNYDYP